MEASRRLVRARDDDGVRAEMVFFETPSGGAVFSVGSIQWAASLPHNSGDNNVARISSNVLRRFVDARQFEMPSAIDIPQETDDDTDP